jgi:hypothetical protein
MKTYTFFYEDRKGNDLGIKELPAFNIKEARKIRDRLFAECMLNDCSKIKVRRKY